MSTRIRAWAAEKSGAPLQPFEYDAGPLGPEQVEVAVEHCGVCHSDVSMLDNEWGNTAYPFVPGTDIALGTMVLPSRDLSSTRSRRILAMRSVRLMTRPPQRVRPR